MYVCVCNAVTEDHVRGCVAAGAASAKEVRAACGMRPGCGSCTQRLHALVNEGNLVGEGSAAARLAATCERTGALQISAA
jgi:bacterioferritin-associated ferredoxin